MPAPTAEDTIDLVDDTNEVIGHIERGHVFDARAGFRTVHVFVRNDAGELLLQQISKDQRRSPLLWGSSVAGYLHAGEDYDAAAKRRIVEEIGINPSLTIVGVIRMNDDGATKFVGLFEATAQSATIQRDAHIRQLKFWNRRDIDRTLRQDPRVFTKTFTLLYNFYGEVTRDSV